MIFTLSSTFTITEKQEDFQEIIDYLDDFAYGLHLPHKEILHLHLLTEETLGMLRAILDEYEGQIWFEQDFPVFRICFSVRATMSPERRDALLEVSSDGKNAASRGIMGKIGTFIANGLSDYGHAMDVSQSYGGASTAYMRMGMDSPADNNDLYLYDWSLSRYRDSVQEEMGDEAGDAWDELEKSIVARLASDVVVGVRGGKITISIAREIPRPEGKA